MRFTDPKTLFRVEDDQSAELILDVLAAAADRSLTPRGTIRLARLSAPELLEGFDDATLREALNLLWARH